MKTMVKTHQSVAFDTAPDSLFLDWNGGLQNGWELVGGVGKRIIGSENYLDLSGLSQEDKTLFFQAITVQSPMPPEITGAGAAPGAFIVVHDYLTSIPLNLDDNIASDIDFGLGFPESTLNFESVVYGRIEYFSLDIDYNSALPVRLHSNQIGSGQPTAGDKLYSYRFVTWGAGLTDATVRILPARHVLAVEPRAEPMLEHIYRLKRSYETAQIDRD